MKILMVLTSHAELGNTGKKPDFGWKSLPRPISSLKMPGLMWSWPRQRVDSRRLILKVIYPNFRPR